MLAGDTYGLIRFGSRVDTYLPVGSELVIRPGQRTIGGETVLATLDGHRRRDRRRPDGRQYPGVRFLPNAITVLALCAGLTSVAFAMSGRGPEPGGWRSARSAPPPCWIRWTVRPPGCCSSTSRIGAELDSLSDCISFGVAPALVMYVWLLRDEGRGYGWVVCLIFAVCAALRLARFNSLLDDDDPKPWAKGFFTGVPTPAGGLMVTAPLLLSNRLGYDGFWAAAVGGRRSGWC